MTQWIRFEHGGKTAFGTLEGQTITVHTGELLDQPKPTGQKVQLSQVRVLAPVKPGKIVALWNNFHALAAKLGLSAPPEPLYFIKASTSVLEPGGTIRRPRTYDGKVVFEGELGVVIGKTARGVAEAEAEGCIFGYTCVNDVTAAELLKKDSTFDQWTRAKSFDTFGPVGPVVATGLNPATLKVRSVLNGDQRQDYPISDMVFGPARLVHMISQDLTLEPGDIISCGTSLGVGSMKPGSTVQISIEGIGTLTNSFE